MTVSWRDDYDRLKQYLSLTPAIQITSNKTVIPGENREDFYRLFDAVKNSFLFENFASRLEEGQELSANFEAVQYAVLSKSELDSIELAPDLGWFLKDPLDGVARCLTNPLFNLLSGKADIDIFEQGTLCLARDAFARLFKAGYQKWVALAMLMLLDVDANYRVPAVDVNEDCLLGEGHENAGQHAGDVPEPQQVKTISFEQNPVITFVVPRVLVHSVSANAFLALHHGFVEAEWTARKISDKTEWLRIAELKTRFGINKVRPDLLKKTWYELEPILPDLAVYSAPDVKDLALVADYNFMLRPAVNLEIMEDSDWYQEGRLADIRRHHAATQPTRGTFIVCRHEPPVEAWQELIVSEVEDSTAAEVVSPIKVIHAGYDINSLEEIIIAVAEESPVRPEETRFNG